MFENIIAKETINFNDLENEVYKFVCKLGCSIIKDILEEIDNELMKKQKSNMRNKGLRKNSIKTIMGTVEFKRRVYEDSERKNKEKKYRYVLDESIDMYSNGKISNNLLEKVLDTVVQTTSYRKASNEIEELTGINLSHEAIRKLTMYAGEKIEENEKEAINLKKENKLQKGTKEIPILFEEADGLWINLQGKDRQEQIEKNKKQNELEGKKYIQPKRVKAELKLHECYEGWKLRNNRYEIVNKMYIAGFMTTEEIKQLRETKIYSKYNIDKIQYRIINGDGALWINKLAGKNIIRQKDKFHIHQEIIRDIEEKEEQEKVRKMFEQKEYKKIIPYIEELKYKSGGEEKAIKRLEKLQTYLDKDIERYTDMIKLPEAPEGLEYRNLGTMESQIFTIFSKRFKGRKAFSKKGATYLAKVSAKYKEGKNNFSLKKIDEEYKIDKEVIYAEEYIKKLEKNYKENYDAYIATMGKTKEGIKETHTIKNYNTSNFDTSFISKIKDILRFEENSEMTLWQTFNGAYKNYKNSKHS
jgi:hypothetical protein